MIISIWDSLKEISNNFKDFIMKNFDNPFFWIIIFGILLAIAIAAISNLADK